MTCRLRTPLFALLLVGSFACVGELPEPETGADAGAVADSSTPTSDCPRARVTVSPGSNLNVRASPTTAAPVVGKLPSGTIVDVRDRVSGEVIEGNDEWMSIESTIADGYISAVTLAEVHYVVRAIDGPDRAGRVVATRAARPGVEVADDLERLLSLRVHLRHLGGVEDVLFVGRADDDLLGIEFVYVDAHLFHHLLHLPWVHTAASEHGRQSAPGDKKRGEGRHTSRRPLGRRGRSGCRPGVRPDGEGFSIWARKVSLMSGLLPSDTDAPRGDPSEERAEGDDGDLRVLWLDDEDADQLIGSLSSETARAVLTELHHGPATASELSDDVDTSLQNVRHHLNSLQEAGLVQVADTRYSVKGREMNVYAPTDDSLVVCVGREDDRSSFLDSLKRLVGTSKRAAFSHAASITSCSTSSASWRLLRSWPVK